MTGFVKAERHSETASMNKFSDISGAPLVADAVPPSEAGSRRGRLSYDASCSVSLPWTIHTQRGALFPLSFPSSALASGREYIDPCPDFRSGSMEC
jgi:hypothetical protein